MLKILQARLQQYMNHELPDVQARLRKGKGTRDQIANIHWIIEKAREFQKNIYFCFIDYAKAYDCVSQQTGKFFRDGNTRPSDLLLEKSVMKVKKQQLEPDITATRSRHPVQEATVRTGHGIRDWFQISKAVYQGYMLSPC